MSKEGRTVKVEMPGFFMTALTLIFITLKLTGYIDWSWWWVLSPIWIPMAFAACIMLFILVVWVFATKGYK